MNQPSSITPVAAHTPQDLASLVRQAIDTSTPIIDYGKAHQHTGNPPPAPPAPYFLLDQSISDDSQSVLDLYEKDMTVRVAAGATLGQVQAALAKQNQFVPIDADLDLTIAEIILANIYGPLRLSMGSIRDLLLGLSYIDGQARDIQVGGRTVKNVAGLDVTRLMVGSLGELGLLHQAVLRTYAIPEQSLVVQLQLSSPALLDTCLTDWVLADACPSSMTLTHNPTKGWLLRVAYHGKPDACIAQYTALEAFLETHQGLQVIGQYQLKPEQDLQETSRDRQWQREATAVVKLIVPPASTGQVVLHLQQAFQNQDGLKISALPSHGCIVIGGSLDAAQAVRLNQAILDVMTPLQGVRTWVTRPQEVADLIRPFDPMPPSLPWLLSLKNTMDPHQLFNPGRCLVDSSSPALSTVLPTSTSPLSPRSSSS